MFDSNGLPDSGLTNMLPLVPFLMESHVYPDQRADGLNQDYLDEVRKIPGDDKGDEDEIYINRLPKDRDRFS